jgi:hypothetical protein
MRTRTINNIGNPLISSSGDILDGVKITFTLVKNNKITSTFDTISKERIVGVPVSVITNINGEFSINLWPPSRGQDASEYICVCDVPNIANFKAPLIDGDIDLKWFDWINSGGIVSPQELSAFAVHVQDYVLHLTADQNAAMDAANSPSAVNAFATLADLLTSSTSPWGFITGNLTDQTDLKLALDNKQPLADVLTNTTASFTTSLETKLNGIADGATVQTQTDWNASTGLGVILNKPTIPTVPTTLASFTDDTTHRLVTDTEKSTWDAKQNALGFTAVATDDNRLTNDRTPTTHGNDKHSVTYITQTDAVAPNTTIVAGTGTKITYDAKGLVTSSTSASATDIGLSNVDNVKQLPIAGGTMTGELVAAVTMTATQRQVRNILIGTVDPTTEGYDGDVYFKYIP